VIDRDEATKRRREEARNSLEGYLYRVRDLLSDPNAGTPFMKCSQEEERKVLAEKVEETISWLHDKGDLAETSQLYDKRNAVEYVVFSICDIRETYHCLLRTLERPIVHRYQEIEAFPQVLNNSQKWNWSTRLFLTEARQNLTEEEEAGTPSKWTREELMALEKTLREHEKWLHEWVEKQKSVKMNEDPVITTTEMKARAKTLELHLQKLVKRKIPKTKPKKSVVSETTTATATGSAAADEMSTGMVSSGTVRDKEEATASSSIRDEL
jgi:hypoxia up-regulated 1